MTGRKGKTLTEGLRVNVTPEQLEAITHIATRDDRSVASVVRRFIREGLAREADGKVGT